MLLKLTKKAILNLNGTRKFKFRIWKFTRRDPYLDGTKFGLVKIWHCELGFLE